MYDVWPFVYVSVKHSRETQWIKKNNNNKMRMVLPIDTCKPNASQEAHVGCRDG